MSSNMITNFMFWSVWTTLPQLSSIKTSIKLSVLQECKVTIEARMKLIKLADSSDHGWQTVAEYMTNELADNSDDEKRIEHAEKLAEKKAKKVKASKISEPRPFRV